jgi:hypothetical protein
MKLTRMVTMVLALGLLLPPLAGATEPVKSATDEKGVIHIGAGTTAPKEKAGDTEKKGEEKAQPGKAATETAAPPAAPPPGLYPSHSRRLSGPAAEAKRKAFERAHPNLVPHAQQAQTPAPKPPMPQPAQPQAPAPR